MTKIFSKKNSIISLILIITTVSMPLAFLPIQAEAQTNTGTYSGAGNSYLGSGNSYTASIGSAISTLPLCQSAINSSMSSLFTGLGNLLGGSNGSSLSENNPNLSSNMSGSINGAQTMSDSQYAAMSQSLGLSATQAAQALGASATSIPVNIDNTPTGQAINQINTNTQITKDKVTSMQANDTCLQSIGRLIAKTLLQKITLSTIDWINHGFNGGPAFIQDPGTFFGNLTKEQVLQFGVEISDPTLYPFGKSFLQNEAASLNNQFAYNAQYSLNNLIQQTTPQYTATDFSNNFSEGGWDAWSNLTQIPANNPLGFQLMASEELNNRIQNNTQQTQNMLQQSGGFLGDMRCVDPNTGQPNSITQAQKDSALTTTGGQDPCVAGGDKWEYVTPGKLIADAATQAMHYPQNNLLNVQDLNDAVASVMDAIINHFSTQIMGSGFANISTQGSDGSLVYNSGTVYDGTTQAQKDFSPVQLTSSWLTNNPNFNIRTDLTQALIDTQRTYAEKLQKQNDELVSTTDGKPYKMYADGQTNSYGLIPAIYQLDYCVPGPHPGWENDAKQTLAAVENDIVPETKDSLQSTSTDAILATANSLAPLAGQAIGTVLVGLVSGTTITLTTGGLALAGAAAGSVVPVIGTIIGAVIGGLISYFMTSFSSDDYAKVRLYYSTQLRTLTGINPADEGGQAAVNNYRHLNLQSKQGLVNVLNKFLDRYIGIMNSTYFSSPDILPAVAPQAASEYEKLKGYGQMRINNENKITEINGIITQLEQIKTAIDTMNAKLDPNSNTYDKNYTSDQYNNDLQPQIDAFANISANMVNENDIATVDNMTQQIIQEKNYVYDDLLKGPNGCEAELEKTQVKFPFNPNPTYANPGALVEDPANTWDHYDATSVERMTYPYNAVPILYDYNHFTPNSILPDPWGKDSNYCQAYPDSNTCQYDYSQNFIGKSTEVNTDGNPNDIRKLYDSNNNYIYGPGFLSFVFFGNHPGGVPDCATPCREGSERLETSDLVTPSAGSDSKYRAVGLREPGTGGLDYSRGGPFETSIGIY